MERIRWGFERRTWIHWGSFIWTNNVSLWLIFYLVLFRLMDTNNPSSRPFKKAEQDMLTMEIALNKKRKKILTKIKCYIDIDIDTYTSWCMYRIISNDGKFIIWSEDLSCIEMYLLSLNQ